MPRSTRARRNAADADERSLPGREGVVEIGAAADGFAFDCERPRHRALLHPHAIADRCVTNGEWAEFIADGGYDDAGAVAERRVGLASSARRSRRRSTGLATARRSPSAGGARIDPAAPVAQCQLLRGRCLRALGGQAAADRGRMGRCLRRVPIRSLGHQLDRAGAVLPRPGGGPFGDVWQWTAVGLPALPRLRARGGHGRRI